MTDITETFSSWSSTAGNNSPSGTTNIGSGLSPNLRAIQAVVAAWRDGVQWGGLVVSSVSGTNTITGTVSPTPTAYASGMKFRLIPANSNTGAATFNASSLGARNIFLNGAALVGYELRKNCPVELVYDGTQFNIVSGAHGGDGTAIATVKAHAGSTTPNGYLACDGSAVSRTTYADLFAVVSTTYGVGDGSTTFNVPDCTGRVIAGKESSATRLTSGASGVDGGTLGATGGNQNMHQHTHTATVTDPGHAHNMQVSGTQSAGLLFQDGGAANANRNTDSATTGITVANANAGSGSSQNVQPTIVLNYMIKF